MSFYLFVYLTLTRPIGQKKSRTPQNMSYIWSGVPLSYLQLYGSLIVWSQHFRSLLSEGVPRVPSTFNFFQGKLKFVSPFEVRGGTIRGPWWHHSRSHVVAPFEVQDTNSRTKIFQFRAFLGPSDQNQLYHTPLLSKIWGLSDRKFFGEQSL